MIAKSVKNFPKGKPLVGIDLGGASSPAPGTARHVAEQARALLSLDLPWTWLPVVESRENPLWKEIQHLGPVEVSQGSRWRRASFEVGQAWSEAGCAMGFATAYFVPWNRQPVVANFFDSNIYEHFDTWVKSGRLANALLIRLLSDYAVRRAGRLFTNSHYCRAYLQKKFPRQAEKFVYAPPGIVAPTERVITERPAWAAPLQKPFLLYVGVFSENKNQRRLIEAHRLLGSDAPELVLIGRCDEDYRRAAIEPALNETGGAKVILPGGVSQDELVWAYQNALAYVQPSIAEGFGLPIVEAMSHGLPVACSNTTSLPETAGEAAVLFDPLNPTGMAAAMRGLIDSASVRENLIALGRERWPEFTWKKNAEIVAGAIEETLRKR